MIYHVVKCQIKAYPNACMLQQTLGSVTQLQMWDRLTECGVPVAFCAGENEYYFNDVALANRYVVAHEEAHSYLGHTQGALARGGDIRAALQLECEADLFVAEKLGKTYTLSEMEKIYRLLRKNISSPFCWRHLETRIRFVRRFATSG